MHHPEGRRYLDAILTRLEEAGVRAIRLDAVGYAVKKAGTSCFMIPETFAFIREVTARAHAANMEVLVEVHGHYQEQIAVASQVDWVYDFALPPLILHTLYTRDLSALGRWLEIRPHNAVTVLDTHDGIGVIDAGNTPRDRARPALLTPEQIDQVVDQIHARSHGVSRQASGGAARNLDIHQVNCTFYDALGRRDDEYLVARAIQCFVPGIPQIYYVGLLAGINDMELLRRTTVGRDINRHYYTDTDVLEHLNRPVVQRLIALLRLRNTLSAFGGMFHYSLSAPAALTMEWRHQGEWARLDVDFERTTAFMTCSGRSDHVWQSELT